jgi:hypothetical protein
MVSLYLRSRTTRQGSDKGSISDRQARLANPFNNVTDRTNRLIDGNGQLKEREGRGSSEGAYVQLRCAVFVI